MFSRKRDFWSDHARMPHRRKHQIARAACRFVVGRDLDGQRRTDARWNKHGTQPLTPTGHASRWAHYPHKRRAGIRNLTVVFFTFLIVGFIISPASTAATLRVIVWITLITLGWVVWEKSRRYAHRKELIGPMGDYLASIFNDSRYALNPRDYIQIPVDVLERPSRIYLPLSWSGKSESQERTLAYAIGRKIGLSRPSFDYEHKGDRPYLELRPAPAPRDVVPFSDPTIREIVDALREGQLLLGLGPRDVPYVLDLNKYPHPGFSMATNAGKSITVRGLIMQTLHKGGNALVLDPKMDSQLWCRDLPNARYADTPEEMHDALMWLAAEVDRRSAIAKIHTDIHGDIDPELVGPRILVVVEELNSLESKLKVYWRSIRQPGDPILPPSLTALGTALNMGRARLVNILPVAQELLVQSLGGPAAKTNISARVLGRAKPPTWNKLAPECKVNGRYPRYYDHPGRVYVIAGEDPVLVQTMIATVDEAREYSMSGIVTPFPDGGFADPIMNDDFIDVPFDVEFDDRALEAPSRIGLEPDPITLTEAIQDGIYLGNIEALRRASNRPGFPPSIGRRGAAKLYDKTALEAWAAPRRNDAA